MLKQYVITMSTNERQAHEKICKETLEILQDMAKNIEDQEEKNKFWDKIRKFKHVADCFKE